MQQISQIGVRHNALTEREFQQLQAALVEDARARLQMRGNVWAAETEPDWVQEVAFDPMADMALPALGGKLDEPRMDMIDTGARVVDKVGYLRVGGRVHWKDLASSRQLGRSLDTTWAREAGRTIATKENNVLANGDGAMQGLLSATGRLTQTGTDWDTTGDPYDDVRKAVGTLQDKNFYGPYQLVVSPVQAGNLRKMRSTSVDTTHRDKIEDMLQQEGGGQVVVDAAMPNTSAIVTEGRNAANYRVAFTPDVRLLQEAAKEWTELLAYEVLVSQVKRAKSILEVTAI